MDEQQEDQAANRPWPPHWRDIDDPAVLGAIKAVPRHLFVPAQFRERAYEDIPLPIGQEQTISQPYIVALMTQALALTPASRVLEIGTGSGYQAAVLGHLCDAVFTIELIPELLERAKGTLAQLGISNVRFRLGDGAAGWPEEAPFDGILVTAAAERIPPALLAQLRPGGRMIIPIGGELDVQFIHVVQKDAQGRVEDRELFAVRFVPLRGGGGAIAVESLG